MRTLVLGDIHGAFPHDLNQLSIDLRPDLILQVGDFGFWAPGGDPCEHIKPICPVHFADGNHEDHWLLRNFRGPDLAPQAHDVCPGAGVFWQDRGSTLTLPDGRTILFVGGAESVDQYKRVVGVDWFPKETLSQADLAKFPDPDKIKVDIVVSHTCPLSFQWDEDPGDRGHGDPGFIEEKRRDPSCKALDLVLELYRPMYWFFGHFHRYHQGEYQGCKWTCLACPPYQGGKGTFWEWLPDSR